MARASGIKGTSIVTLEYLLGRAKLAPSGCMEWTGNRMNSGYGQCNSPHLFRTAGAHRIAFELANNVKLQPGQVVRHSCDNKICINPEHLLVGTSTDNNWDTARRGHWARTVLTEAQAREIFRLDGEGMRVCDIAKRLNCSYNATWGIVNGATWKWLRAELKGNQ